jgi:signal transduction histidine kinase
MTSQPLRILLLDDNPNDRVMAIRALRREFSDLRVEQIADAESLGRSLEAGDFDLVITECQLHWTDGLAVLSAVKAAWPDRPVIMFTGTGSEEIAVEAMKAGLDDYLPKSPEHFNRLPAAVRSALAQAQERPALGEVETRHRTECQRLLRAGQQQSRRLTLLADIARTVADTLNADSLLQAVADAIHRHLAYPSVGLFTLDDKGQTLILRGYSGVSANPPELTAVGQPIERGITGCAARTGKPRLARDVTTAPSHQPPDQVTMRSELCVPILEAGRSVGVIDVLSDRRADFDEEDRSLLQAVADTVGIGLRNARLHDESRRRSQELTLLNRISVRFGAVLNLDTLINDALEGLHELVNADRTYFITVDPDARTWETTHERVAPGIEMDVGLTGAFDDAPVELQTLLEGQPFAVFDTATDPRVEATREIYRSLGAQSTLLVPVRYGKRLYGALGFDNCREKRVWYPDEVRLLEGVAHQLELALENLHLFEEVRLRADESAAALARLEELDRLKDRFIQNVSHELRSPLAITRGYVEMLEAGELGELRPKQQKPVAIIGRRVRMLSDLVQDITLILEAEVSPPEPEAVALDELVRMAAEDFQLAVEQAELTLHTDIVPHLPPVSASYGYLRRVLDNLLGNAVKFTPAGGTITVRVQQEGEQVALEVSDTGVGIPPDQLEHIFKRFYQVDNSIWRQYGGVGLGLALVKELVETYGGSVAVESQVGEGSTFTVLLPIATDTDGRGEKPQDTHGEHARTS